jgi:predicted Rossmann-fold nucleotide-binding protein
MRIVVTGGRDYADAAMVDRALSAMHRKHGIDILIQGGADGADRLCAEWAWERGIPVATYNAEWKAHGKAAGPLRNQRMIDEGKPDAAVAFPGGTGTADMLMRLAAAEIRTWEPVR